MILEFALGRRPTGDGGIVLQFDARLEYEVERFEFQHGLRRTPIHIKEILTQYAAIDAAKIVILTGKTSLIIGRIPVLLNARVFIQQPEVVSWSIDPPKPSALLVRGLMRRLMPKVEPLNIVLAGTVRAVLPELRERQRHEVREQAIQQARTMRYNAEAILTYLNIPE